jgi:hypothetical protein
MLQWKEVISPGTYWYLDADNKPAVLNATPERIRRWHDAGKEMRAAGMTIPIPLEHDLSLFAMSNADRKAETLKNNAGFVEDFKLEDETLYALTRIEDPSILEKLPSTIKFTSPWINPVFGPNGKQWDEGVTHLALTSRPRITKQAPFTNVAAALSMAASTPGLPKGGVFLSRAGKVVDGEPVFSGAFSVWSGVTLAEEPPKKPVAKEEKPKGEVPPKKGEKPPGKDGEVAKTEEEVPGAEDEFDTEMDLVDVFCDIASVWGIDLPEGTTEENVVARFIEAGLAKIKSEKGIEMPTEPTPAKPNAPQTKPNPNPVIQEHSPMYMTLSVEDVAKITDPEKRQLAGVILSLQTKLELESGMNKKLQEAQFNDAKTRRGRRIQALARHLPKEIIDKLNAMASGAQLSMGEDGKVKDTMEEWLEIYERTIKTMEMPDVMKPGAVFTVQPHPEDTTNGPNHQTKERREELLQMVGVPTKK